MERTKRSKRTSILVGVTIIGALVFALSALVFPASASTFAERGHWVDNIGAGYIAAEFNGGNTHPTCAAPPFGERTSDLWVFEITGATDSRSIPRWDASVPSWTFIEPIEILDVTAEYGGYLPNTTTKRLYIETSPPGARLNAAHIFYEGDSTSEVLLFTCAQDLDIELKAPLGASYDMEYRWSVEARVDWKADHPYIFDISYFTHRSRDTIPVIRSGSMHVRGSIQTGDSELPIDSATVEYQAGDHRESCPVDTQTFDFDCTVDDHFVMHDSTNGRPFGKGYVSVSIDTPMGPASRRFAVDWGTITPTNVLRVDAQIRNHAAMAPHDEISVSPFVTTSVYRETWVPGSDYCSTNQQVFELTTDPDPDPDPEDQVITTVTWCRPRPGYSLQYLGGPYGVPMLAAGNAALRVRYPSVLADLPPLSDRDGIRDFLDSIACLQSCRPLFQAQFLTAAINALDPGFAQQVVLIGDECKSVAKYLEDVDAEASRLDETGLVIRKSELERINGALITTCPTVSTTASGGLASSGG